MKGYVRSLSKSEASLQKFPCDKIRTKDFSKREKGKRFSLKNKQTITGVDFMVEFFGWITN